MLVRQSDNKSTIKVVCFDMDETLGTLDKNSNYIIYPTTPTLIEDCAKQNYRVHVVSGNAYQSKIVPAFEAKNITSIPKENIHCPHGNDDIDAHKGNPATQAYPYLTINDHNNFDKVDLIHAICQREAVDKNSVVIADNSLGYLAPMRKAGYSCVLVETEANPEYDFRQSPCGGQQENILKYINYCNQSHCDAKAKKLKELYDFRLDQQIVVFKSDNEISRQRSAFNRPVNFSRKSEIAKIIDELGDVVRIAQARMKAASAMIEFYELDLPIPGIYGAVINDTPELMNGTEGELGLSYISFYAQCRIV